MKNKSSQTMRITALFLCLCVVLCCTGCAAPQADVFHTVSFFSEGTLLSSQSVKSGEQVALPSAPVKKNHSFRGWFTDSSGKSPFDPSQEITGDLALYASFSMDAAKITNEITMDTIRAIVKITATHYNRFLGFKTDETASQGSGVIISDMASGRLLVITNCHVVQRPSDRAYSDYEIYDYLGNKYSASLSHSVSGNGYAVDPTYDLACLSFDPAGKALKVMEFADLDPEVSENVISLGYPKGQSNSITFGTVEGYRSITLDNTSPSESNVTFPVVHHTAMINSGSSGGVLLNSELELVGINYAAQNVSENEFNVGFAIPLSKVQEFLKAYIQYY